MKKGLLFFSIIVVSMMLGTCKKYPEGPFLSFRSKGQRIDAEWNISSYTCNGDTLLSLKTIDSGYYSVKCGQQFFYTYQEKIRPAKMNFGKDGRFPIRREYTIVTTVDPVKSEDSCSVFMQTYIVVKDYLGVGWKFSDNKKQITIKFDRGGMFESATYDILELKEKKMKWKGTNTGNSEEFTFTKIEE